MINNKEIKKFLNLKGKVRGVTLNTDIKYILKMEGQAGFNKVRKELKKIVPDIKYGKETSNINWYPISWRVLSILVAKDVFKWSEKDIFNMGLAAPGNSFIVKTLLRYFFSMEKTFKEASKYWEKHYSVGTLTTEDINMEKKYLIPVLRDFKIHPDLCVYYAGYFQGLSQLILRADKINIIEEKCMFRGDKYHKYVIRWE